MASFKQKCMQVVRNHLILTKPVFGLSELLSSIQGMLKERERFHNISSSFGFTLHLLSLIKHAFFLVFFLYYFLKTCF